ncbi:MAG TPA: sigma-54 dependent transcriptional regulator [Candidatus Sumerlaeota bacterium]|nr:sigma-54 dependent transcriptional regulator [Candidatus Sumerlaeota bacterium]
MGLRIVLLDDEPKMGKILRRVLEREGHSVRTATEPAAALEAIEREGADLLLTDLKMPGMDGLEVMRRARERVPDLDVIMMTAYATAETAVEAMKQGAADYLIKPFANEELIMVVARVAETRGLRAENRQLKDSLESQAAPRDIVAVSPAMREVMTRVRKVAASNVSVLLRGESGTGKEVLALAIHAGGPRRDKPLVKINCGALPETLLESELFGHTRGAFTGAVETRKGLFEQADGGTIFLDEVGELSPALQVKLLRVLQSGEFQRVGDAQTFRVDVRVIAATHRVLEEMIEEGTFRSDLYYRLNVVPIEIPPLRERPEDVPALIDHFLARIRRRDGQVVNLAPAAFDRLLRYHWPGNIRELENALEHACVMCDGNTIEVRDLPQSVQHGVAPGQAAAETAVPRGGETLEDIERRVLIEALEATGYNHTRAARKLGITRRTLGYRMDKYRIPRRAPNRGEPTQGEA